MKSLKMLASFGLALSLMIGFSAWDNTSAGGIEVGDLIPMMGKDMKSVSGDQLHLRELHKENGLLVVFSCNTCPFVIQWEDRYNELYELCESNNVGMVLVNSNEAKRSGADSYEAMKSKADEQEYKMPYVVDQDHMVADAFGAKTTPHVFLFDRDAKLAYKGAIDDNSKDKTAVTEHYLTDAINAMVKGETISPATTKALGCSIKRVQ